MRKYPTAPPVCFNSLFEMLARLRLAEQLVLLLRRFNSLFEMRSLQHSFRQQLQIVVSILYLRCDRVGWLLCSGRDVGLFQFSI